MFKAIKVDKGNSGYTATLEEIDEKMLPEGEVTVSVEYSTLNYKDALAITGKSPVVRSFPMVPGIDFSGTVVSSRDSKFSEGDRVLLNGWGVGENHWGGLSQRARVKADWLLPLPEELSTEDAMGLGTAGYTAMLCVKALAEHGVRPEHGDILVTGAAGGVGSVALYLLAKRGYRVVASTGRSADSEYLTELGASEIIDREELNKPGKPLGKERWVGAVDVVGSHTLANICASTKYGGVVTACGLAQGMELPASVAPFILRGVSLVGIDSVYCPLEKRKAAWADLAKELDVVRLQSVTETIGLSETVSKAQALLDGKIRGRLVVDVNR
ncbi:oxidoreductase [Pseudomaricurvus alkylphenolicus]|uniref:acrylyl-CoA reductase (NADPH) n=1 Tax=Pseudomaricurvus alkylphenolicus TaxID=1306991 RepID=UPI00141FDE49|nr:MDR family oxidoreductase [Pseudomaricurvus alkylphenolicus]NIB43510.1 oxidoreductase [Pseudomaricurvus alkylphenolicus]